MGFRSQKSGFRSEDLGFRNEDANAGSRLPAFRPSDSGPRISDLGLWTEFIVTRHSLLITPINKFFVVDWHRCGPPLLGVAEAS